MSGASAPTSSARSPSSALRGRVVANVDEQTASRAWATGYRVPRRRGRKPKPTGDWKQKSWLSWLCRGLASTRGESAREHSTRPARVAVAERQQPKSQLVLRTTPASFVTGSPPVTGSERAGLVFCHRPTDADPPAPLVRARAQLATAHMRSKLAVRFNQIRESAASSAAHRRSRSRRSERSPRANSTTDRTEQRRARQTVALVPRNRGSAHRLVSLHTACRPTGHEARRQKNRPDGFPSGRECHAGGGSALGRSRTFNLRIKSPLLCQLSYECKL